ncbi:MAG: helix-turn-helix domain-containing protein [Opitutaceae bacterium]
MKIENRTFDVSIPTTDGESIAELISIQIPMEWDEEIQEWLMTDEGLQKVEETKARHMGLMLPAEIRGLRERLNLTQKEISEALQIGEKTWSPWENGRNRPSRSINLLLRALDDGKITIDYLKAVATTPAQWVSDAHYMTFAPDTLFCSATELATDALSNEESEEYLEAAVA